MSNLIFIPVKGAKNNPQILSEIARLNIDNFSAYYKEYYGDSLADLSFFIYDQQTIIGYCACFKLNNQLCFPHEGLRLIFFTDLYERVLTRQEKKNASNILDQIMHNIDKLAIENECSEIVIKDALKGGLLSLLGKTLFNNKYHAQMTFEMDVDFNGFTEETFFSGIRKCNKPQINWGKKNLETTVVSSSQPSYEKFSEFKKFHEVISGRKTRSDASWDLQYKMLLDGHGELLLANYNGNLAAGGLFIDQYDTSIYFTAVYDRSLFEYGISHYILYQGICDSFKRGKTKKFSLGYFETDIKDDKWYNIQSFKRGFCDDLIPTIFWKKSLLQGA